MKKMDAKEMQSRLLQMLKQFHQLCEENNLRYYMIGGTCLGAKRHNGFIPWDDDVDIGMPREDYERFCTLPSESFPENLEIRYFRNTKKSPFCFVKLVDNNTTLIEQAYKNYVEGLYIDIFPFDGVKEYPVGLFERLRLESIWFRKVMVLYNTTTLTRKNILKKVLIFLAKHSDLNRMQNKLDKKLKRYSFENSKYVINYLGAYKYREILRKDILGTPKLYSFEDTQFYGPEKIEDFLTQIYGDYMKLPPEKDRVFKHDYYYLDLNCPFRKYEERNR